MKVFNSIFCGLIGLVLLASCTDMGSSGAEQTIKGNGSMCNDSSSACSQAIPSRFNAVKHQ